MVRAAVALILASQNTLGAQTQPAVALEIDSCVPVRSAEVRRLLGLELGTTLLERPRPDVTRVSASCASPEVVIRVDDSVTGKVVQRTIALAQVPEGVRDRLLAVAIAELVVASWAELGLRRSEAPIVAERAPAAVQRAALAVVRSKTPPGEEHAHVLGAFSARRLWSGTGTLLGGGARLHWLWRRVALGLDVTAEKGEPSTSVGSVSVTSIGGGAALLAWVRQERGTLWGGGGGRLALAQLQGNTDLDIVRARSLTAVWGGPMGLCGATLSVNRLVVLAFGLEVGYVTRPVRALVLGDPEVALEGPWISAHLALGIRL